MPAATQSDAPSWPAQLAADLTSSDQAAKKLLAGLTVEQVNWALAAGSWSVGQCLEHLCMTNESYLAPIHAALEAQPDAPVSQITQGWFARWFIRNFVEPSPGSKRVSAPLKIRPSIRIELSILDRFVASNDALRKSISQAERKDVNRIRFKNPFVPLIRFTVGTGFQILTAHERRHLLQAERVRSAPSFPASS
jgi:hypothetical protein